MLQPCFKRLVLIETLSRTICPISNLSYISKLRVKAVAKQISEYIVHEGIWNINQPAYRDFHSTEMAMLKIQNDIATSMDKGTAVGLVLQHWYGIDGVVLKWVQSYLNSRKIKIDRHFSDAFQLSYEVPQGSVLGPLFFTLYITLPAKTKLAPHLLPYIV